MTTLALTAPTVTFGDPEIVSGFDLTAIVGTSIAANNTVTIPWAQNLLLYCTGATSNTVTLTFVSPSIASGASPNYTTGNIVATHAVVFGPISNIWANTSGLVTVTITGTVTGMTFASYLAPLQSGAKHNPFEMAGAGAADY
jgi:hypothetical protein